jgi:hypothetical protein
VQLHRGERACEDEWLLFLQPLLPEETALPRESATSTGPTPAASPTSSSSPLQSSLPHLPVADSHSRSAVLSPSVSRSGPPSHPDHPSSGPSSSVRARLGVRRRFTAPVPTTPKPLPPSHPPQPSIAPSITASPSIPIIEQKRQVALHRLNANPSPSSLHPSLARVESELRDTQKAIERLSHERGKDVDESETHRLEVLREKWLRASQLALTDLLECVQRSRGEEVSMAAMMRGLGVDSDMVHFDVQRGEFIAG